MNIPQLLVALLMFLSVNAFSQHRNAIWQMGSIGGGTPFQFDFSSGSLVIQPFYRIMNINRTNSSICSETGDLLFYTNGIFVANALHDTMFNGSGLNPGSGTTSYNYIGSTLPQAAIILPDIADTNQYYIFHLVSNQYNNLIADNLFYTKVDMSLHGGLGAVTQKNVILTTDAFAPGELVATKHANGRDWWLISHLHLSGKFLKYLIDLNGVHGPFVQTIGVSKIYSGQAAFSQDGSLFASYDNTNGLEVFAFNRCNGELSKYRHVDILDGLFGAGVSISPNSRYIYVSSNLYLYQFDILSANFSDYDTVAVYDGFYSFVPPKATTFYHQALASDGKVYINSFGDVHHLSIINNPDLPGLNCNVQQHSILMPGSSRSMPSFPNYYLGPLIGSPCDGSTPVNSIDQDESLTINVYPNPSDKRFNIEWSGHDDLIDVLIFDISGRKIECSWTSDLPDNSISVKVESINSGVFFVKARTASQTYSGKVVFND